MLPIGTVRRSCHSLSLRTKLLIVIALPMIGLVTVVLVVATRIEIQQTKQFMVANTTSIIRAMSQDFERMDLLDDQKVAVDIVDRLQSFKDIERVYVYDQQGEVVFSYARSDQSPSAPPSRQNEQTEFSKGSLRMFLPLSSPTGPFAVAYVQASTEKVDNNVRRARVTTVFAVGATALLGFGLAIYLQRFISRPILELQSTARTVCLNNDYSVRAVKHNDDELGAVVEAFNAMLDQIEQSDLALQKVHNELEQRVVERTASLASANAQLEEEIAKRESIAAELRQREAKLATILASTIDPLVTIDANGIVQDASDSVESVLGWKPQDLIGHNINIIMPEPHRSAHDSYLEKYLRTGESRLLGSWRELEAQRKDDACFPCEVSIWRVDVPGEPEPLFTGCIRDLTERKQTEREIESLHKQLVDTARKAGMAEIATSVLHNVGNVLTSVNVSSGLIRDKLRNSSVPDLARVVEIIQQHLDDLGTYIEQDERGRCLPQFLSDLSQQMAADEQRILDEVQSLTSNIEHIKDIVAVQQTHAGVSGLIEEVLLSDILEDAIRINSASAERHHVEIVRQFEEIPRVALDKLKILQIMVNLISNAKYALMESETADKRIVVRLSRESDDRVRIDVQDNGVGIPRENMTRIFTHGFTTKKEGHGFGLHSAALAADEIGWTLAAHSDGPGTGATFSLEGECQLAGVIHV